MKVFRNYSLLYLGIILSIILLTTSLFFELDLFEKFSKFIMGFENYEIDEFVFPLFILLFFAYIHESRRRIRQLVQIEKNKVHEAMINASKQVIESFVNEIELFKFKAISTHAFTTEELNIYTEALAAAQNKLDMLSKITDVNEQKIYKSIIKSF